MMIKSRLVFYSLVGLFAAAFIGIIGYIDLSFKKELEVFIGMRELPALSLAIAGRIELIAERQKNAMSAILAAGRIQAWILSGERDPDAIQGYLDEALKGTGFYEIGFVSDRSETYYGSGSWRVRLSKDNQERDGWYYVFRDSYASANFDVWHFPEAGQANIYVNLPILDADGAFLGCLGVSVRASEYTSAFAEFEDSHGVSIFMARQDGRLVYASDDVLLKSPVPNAASLWGGEALEVLYRQRMNHSGSLLPTARDDNAVRWGLYLGTWNNYLIVEQDRLAMMEVVRRSLARFVIPSALIGLGLFGISVLAIGWAVRLIDKERRLDADRLLGSRARLYVQTQAMRKVTAIGEKLKLDCDKSGAGDIMSAAAEDIARLLKDADALFAEPCPEKRKNNQDKEIESFDLENIIQDAALCLRSEAASKNVSILVRRGDAAAPRLRADKRIAIFIASELMGAAVDAAPPSSEVLALLETHEGTLVFSVVTRSEIRQGESFTVLRYAVERIGAVFSLSGDPPSGFRYSIRFSGGEQRQKSLWSRL